MFVIMHVMKNFPPLKGLEQFLLNNFRKNTFDTSFDTINILRIVSVKELLFLQQQNITRVEWGIIE